MGGITKIEEVLLLVASLHAVLWPSSEPVNNDVFVTKFSGPY